MITQNRILLFWCVCVGSLHLLNAETIDLLDGEQLTPHRLPKLTVIPRLAVYAFEAKTAQINGPTTVNGTFNVDGPTNLNGTVTVTGQLLVNGSPISGSPAVITITTDSGSVSGNSLSLTATNGSGATVKFTGSGTAITLAVPDAHNNTAIGTGAGNTSATGTLNTAVGPQALTALTSGAQNTAVGYQALSASTECSNNVAIGYRSLMALNGGPSIGANTAIGVDALSSVTNGINNVAIGISAGSAYTTIENNNICIGANVTGTATESDTLRIGNISMTSAFIAGISGVPVTGAGVLVSSSGQLGVASSSRNYKKNIEDIDAQETKLLELRPVTFNYKQEDLADEIHFGLIAEEVAEVIPALVIRDKNGDVQTVKYHELPVLLLAHIKQLATENAELKTSMGAEVAELKARIAAIEIK